jgi:hypothetical protein
MNLDICLRYIKYVCWCLFFLIGIKSAPAQNNDLKLPQAYFRQDSMYVGEHVRLILVYKHGKNQEVLFPDSAFNFYPFEFIKKTFYNTHSDSITSIDSIAYTLTSFELEPELNISLPVYMLNDGDTSTLYSENASIQVAMFVKNISPNDSLSINTNYIQLSPSFNYPYYGLGLMILLLIIIFVLLFFRKKLLKFYRLFLMEKDYNKFFKSYEQFEKEYQSNNSTEILEDTLSVWKIYLEKLEKVPYSTFTTKEICAKFDYNQLTSSLQNFDKAIYGRKIQENLQNSFVTLKETAIYRYQLKQKELRDA